MATTSVPTKRIKLDTTLRSVPAEAAGTVYMFGMGDMGQLGIEAERRKFPALVPELPNGGKEAVQVQCGGTHTLVLLKDGSVYTYGNNDDFALGRDTPEEEDMKVPGKLELNEKVVHVTAGDSHSAALTEEGNVYIWGNFRDANGFMGLLPGKGKDPIKRPVKLVLFRNPGEVANVKIASIASGSNHLIMLGDDGHIFTCGSGEQGQLGRQKLRSSSRKSVSATVSANEFMLTPMQVRTLGTKKVTDIWAGDFTTYCKIKSGPIWVFGLNNHGQLGIQVADAGEEPIVVVPVKSPGFIGKNWVQIAAGEHHSLALDEEGKVHALGRNQDGRLGLETIHAAEHTVWQATPVPRLENEVCVRIACGLSTSYAVSKNKRQLYAWGFGVNYQLATGDEEDELEPATCKFSVRDETLENVVYVSAGAQHVGIIKRDENNSESVKEKVKTTVKEGPGPSNEVEGREKEPLKRKAATKTALKRTASTKSVSKAKK